jgi:hypothetical protein
VNAGLDVNLDGDDASSAPELLRCPLARSGSCDAPPFSAAALARRLPEDVFARYIASTVRRRCTEELQQRQHEEEAQEQHADAEAAPVEVPPEAAAAPKECCVCFEEVPVEQLQLLMPCAHRCMCGDCAGELMAKPRAARACPICGKRVTGASCVFDI